MKTNARFAALLFLLCLGCTPSRPVERVEWPVMGTCAAVQWHAGRSSAAAACDSVRETFLSVESALNAHSPTSEISRLACEADETVLARCSPTMRPCYEAAFRLQRETNGAFNPRWRGQKTLDLGAIAKGFAVDLAVRELERRGESSDLLLDLGGNLCAVGTTWRVGVKSVSGNRIDEAFPLQPGEACATSAEYYRGKHIRDGRTGCAVSNGVSAVTVVCRSAMLADGLSTTLFVLGPEEGRSFLQRHYPDVRAFWTLDDGSNIRTP